MHLVNRILSFYQSYPDLDDFIPLNTPRMYVKKEDNYTIIMFSNGKGRIMGKNATLENIQKQFPDVDHCHLQSETYVHDLGKQVDLEKITTGIYEPELFAARTIHYNDGILINMFHTGKVMLMGKNVGKRKEEIEEYLKNITL